MPFYISYRSSKSLEFGMFSIENEIKYTISNSRCRQVIKWLTCRCKAEAQFNAETVSSIYYDTWGWKSLNEKINSDYLKTKVRFRWYSDITYQLHHTPSFAEAKFRIGTQRRKIRIPTPHSGEWIAGTALSHPMFLRIPVFLETNGVTLGDKYFPVYQVSYKRVRFKEPLTGTKISFDYDIWAPRVNPFMLPNSHPFTLRKAVLELKGAINEMPAFLYPLVDMGCRKESFSKYNACFQKLTELT